MVKLTALRPLSGDYGIIPEGATFEADDQTALSLEKVGLVQRFHEPLGKRFHKMFVAAPENKVVESSTRRR